MIFSEMFEPPVSGKNSDLGRESNGQPAQTSIGNSNPSDDPEVTSLKAAEETANPELVGDTSIPLQQTSTQQSLLKILPTAIEIIDEISTQSPTEHEPAEGSTTASVTGIVLRFRRF